MEPLLCHVRRGRLDERRAVYGFLFSGFRKDRWWFELWNTLRKSLFTMGAVVFGPFGTSMQTWAARVLRTARAYRRQLLLDFECFRDWAHDAYPPLEGEEDDYSVPSDDE